jgi:hypothetical protein
MGGCAGRLGLAVKEAVNLDLAYTKFLLEFFQDVTGLQ